MPEYISREAVSLEIGNVPPRERTYRKAMDIVDTFPAADVVEVVRCRDCENWDTDWVPSHAGKGQYFCPILVQVTDADFYCGCGKRKGGRPDDG